ncbi:MAG TPA: chemotaxis protein CheW [Anaeromyxobacteraceae bacterium]|nr:chemotaxis protein CheW [Anaeromyxobacteraceae bacterium]
MAGRHVVFRVARERYALPLQAVRQVVLPQPPFARVPRAGGAVRGVMNLRGRVVAVVDLAELMGLAPQPLAAGQGHVVILERDKRQLGLLIGGVLGVEPLAPDQAPEPAPGAVVAGVARASMGAVTVLEPAALADAAAALFGAR